MTTTTQTAIVNDIAKLFGLDANGLGLLTNAFAYINRNEPGDDMMADKVLKLLFQERYTKKDNGFDLDMFIITLEFHYNRSAEPTEWTLAMRNTSGMSIDYSWTSSH